MTNPSWSWAGEGRARSQALASLEPAPTRLCAQSWAQVPAQNLGVRATALGAQRGAEGRSRSRGHCPHHWRRRPGKQSHLPIGPWGPCSAGGHLSLLHRDWPGSSIFSLSLRLPTTSRSPNRGGLCEPPAALGTPEPRALSTKSRGARRVQGPINQEEGSVVVSRGAAHDPREGFTAH